MGWFAQSRGAYWLGVLILCGLSSQASAEIFAPVDGERLVSSAGEEFDGL